MKPLLQKLVSCSAATNRCRWVLALLLALLSLPTFAQNATNLPDPPGRFLLLVDTSSSMRRRAEGVLQTVESLLNSDLGGRLRAGDTIGLWTFNEDAYPGRFPLQEWTPATRRVVTTNVLEFLKRQRFEKKSKLDKALTKALPLVRDSSAITFVLLTDGKEAVRGTPFDDRIKAVFSANRREQARVRLPFVTVLRAEQGRFVNGNVGLPPWRIEVPATPGEIAPASNPPPPRKPPQPKPVAPKLAPAALILGGPKPAETPVVKLPDKPAESPKSEPAPPVKPPSTTEPKPTAAPFAPTPESSLIILTAPRAAAPSAPVPAPIVTAPATPAPATEAGQVLEVTKPTAPPAEVAKPATGERSFAITPEAEPILLVPPRVPGQGKSKEPSEPAPVITEIKPAPLASQPQPEASAKALPTETKAEAASPSPPPVAEAKPATPENAGVEKTAPPTAPLPMQEGLVSPQPFLSGPRLLLLGLLLLAVAGMLFWFIVRRSRAVAASGSLISQSLERDKKQ